MILQRDSKINIWGWASPGEKISIKFNSKKYSTKAGRDGKWTVVMLPQKAGGPYSMEISGKNKIVLKDILLGDVWFCSGQSNMVHQLNIHDITYASDIATANYSGIRQFLIPTLSDLQGPAHDLPTGFWKAAVGEDARLFSAVAYFFAKKLYDQYHIPIGIINASVGGTPIESWISEEGLKQFPAIQNSIQKNKDTAYINQLKRRAMAVNAENNIAANDKGSTGNIKWYDSVYIPEGWRTINIPGYWEDQGIKNLDGIVWYRKEIEVPETMAGKAARVFLGRIVDADVLYINGKQVGNTTYQYPQRRYTVPANLLKAGKNIIVIRVTNNNGKGGFVPDKPYCLFTSTDTIDLKGTWQYKVGEVFERPGTASIQLPGLINQPAARFNAMVAPVVNYAIKGFVWYQGESNTGNAATYRQLQAAQITDWRKQWKQNDLPFLLTQLPNFMEMNYSPTESRWAALREAQLQSLHAPNTAMAVTIDLGEWNDIHPDNKKDVGERLALAAKKIAYGENIVYSGPLYSSFTIKENKIILHFDHVGSGLIANDGEALSEFAIAGADKKFVWAKAIIQADKVIVWSNLVQKPMYVRYAWADNPVHPNLYNKEGLPASPFRTDNN
jgi:sialate O-acetylesterase